MLLIPKIDDEGRLNLAAYSFNQQELYAVVETLQNERIQTQIIPLDNDNIGRSGIVLIIQQLDISKLQRVLNVTFRRENGTTTVIFNPVKSSFDGKISKSYRCSRIDTPPHACETIYAGDDYEAVVKCALLAGDRNWLGGVPAPGTC